MACYSFRDGWKAHSTNPSTGKRSIVSQLKKGYHDLPVTMPCGQCIGCRLAHARGWTIRCLHERQMHQTGSFITLTYAPEFLPELGHLDYLAAPGFVKRLREHLSPQLIRTYGCAEYGEKLSRPHYHILIFGWDFPDRVPFRRSAQHVLYTSPLLKRLWPFGHSIVADLTPESIAYTARYVTKKITGPKAEEHYERLDSYGEYHKLPPERAICVSRDPGIGRTWYERYKADVYPHDHVFLKGVPSRPPRYYDNLYKSDDPESFALVAAGRRLAFLNLDDHEFSTSRLAIKQEITLGRFQRLIRSYESETSDF